MKDLFITARRGVQNHIDLHTHNVQIYKYSPIKAKKSLTEKAKIDIRNKHLTCGVVVVVSVKLSSLMLMSPTSSSEGHVAKCLLDLINSKTLTLSGLVMKSVDSMTFEYISFVCLFLKG